jgi:hypothetical protein
MMVLEVKSRRHLLKSEMAKHLAVCLDNQKQKTKAAKARTRIMARAAMLLFRELVKEIAAQKEGENPIVNQEVKP